jgi:hypothetical protein
MKANRLALMILIVMGVFFLYTGCEEEFAEPQQLSPEWFDRFPIQVQQTVASGARPSPLKSARIAFESIVHDFGVVSPETSNLCEFKFKNTGNDTLTIEDIDKSCGCTPFLLEKNEFAPGESGTLRVNYITDTQYGPTTKELTVFSNDAENPEVTLAIKATIKAKIDYNPKSLDLMLKGENAGCSPLSISSIDNKPFSITYVRSTANCITADFDPSVKATSFQLQPKVDMTKLETVLNGFVEIGLSHPECKKITVAMKTLPRYTISPSSITIRRADANSKITRRLRIINNYNERFELTSAASKNGSIRVARNSILPDNRGYELELEITPPANEITNRAFSEEFSLELSNGLQMKIPCYVFYKGGNKQLQTASDGECEVCGAKIIDPKTGKITYANPKAKSGT